MAQVHLAPPKCFHSSRQSRGTWDQGWYPFSPPGLCPSLSGEVTAGPFPPKDQWVLVAGREEMQASYQLAKVGRETGGLGQPFLGRRESMLAAGCQGRKTNQRSIFKSSCGHYPRSRGRGSGRWGRLLGEGGGGWRLTGQRGRASIRTPGLRPASQQDSQPSLCSPTPHRRPSLP